jgi:outer membrane biosynthesis protein TonB
MCSNDRFMRIRLQGCIVLVMTAAAVLLGLAGPTRAQIRSPEITAKERQDPAAGEVVIINRKRKKKQQAAGGKIIAPDPYAPAASPPAKAAPGRSKPKPPEPKQAEQKKPAPKLSAPSKVERKKSPPRKVVRRRPPPRKTVSVRKPIPPQQRDGADTVPPPLPEPLTQPPPARSATARLRQFPRMEPDAEDQRRDDYRRERPPRGSEYAPPRRRYTDDNPYERRYRRPARRFSGGERPWRQCRGWARRCQAGFDRACEQWDGRCMSR